MGKSFGVLALSDYLVRMLVRLETNEDDDDLVRHNIDYPEAWDLQNMTVIDLPVYIEIEEVESVSAIEN
jgi:hypothetical protein